MRCLRSRVQVPAFRYKPQVCGWVHVVAGMVKAGWNAVDKPVTDIIVETLQSAGVEHCDDVVDEPTLLNLRSDRQCP